MDQSMMSQENPQEDTGEQGQLEVCIRKEADGTFSVGVDDGNMQPAQSVDDALTLAKQLLEGGDAGNERAQIAQQVFGGGDQSAQPGELNRKRVGGYGGIGG